MKSSRQVIGGLSLWFLLRPFTVPVIISERTKVCETCGKTFSANYDLLKHRERLHPVSLVD